MCIALISTAHPKYPFILINNRDEFLNRPTAPAAWWQPPKTHVLGGRDLQRAIQGTWLGITRQGRIAVLTNYREEGQASSGLKSRGGIVNSFLTTPPTSNETPADFAARLINDTGVSDVGGFSLAFGQLKSPSSGSGQHHSGLAIISNRTPNADDLVRIADTSGQTHGLSNSHFGDQSWPKVVRGEQLLKELIHDHVAGDSSKEDLVEQLFEVLSVDTLPERKQGDDWDTYVYQLRNSILIPRIGGEEVETQPADAVAGTKKTGEYDSESHGWYATQKQTVILVDTHGLVTFIERTLYDEKGQPSSDPDMTRKFEFNIEGWE